MNAIQGAVKRIRVKTQLTPEFAYDPWAKAALPPEGQGAGGVFMSLLRPQLTVETSMGDVPLAPWGKPEKDHSLLALALLGLVVLGGVTAIGWIARRI